jgi:hypothetical protein
VDFKHLRDTPPWDWPANARDLLLVALCKDDGSESDLELAANLTGNVSVIDDSLVEALLALLRNDERSDRVRSQAAISLGPILDDAYTFGFDDPDEVPISEETFFGIQKTLRALFENEEVPESVRRSILEASVRAPEDWHRAVIRDTYASTDPSWKVTAVFCMRFVRGFDKEILEALDSNKPDVFYQGVCAAGSSELDAAWPRVSALVRARGTDKRLLLAAIEAVVGIRPQEIELLDRLLSHPDREVVEAVHEAKSMAGQLEQGEEELDPDTLN